MIQSLSELTYVPDMPKDPKARKIFIVGAGEIVQDAHLPAYRLAGYPVAGIYNRTVSKAEKLAKEYGILKAYGDLDEMIADAVRENGVFDVALPANLFESVLQKIPDGSGVLLQKPMGECIEEATRLLEICRAKHLTAGVNFQLRQAPYMIQLRKLLADGLIGELYDVDWRVVTLQPWYLWAFLNEKKRAEINYHSIHYVDALRSLLGDPKGVYCKTMKSPKSPNMAQGSTTIIMDYGETLRVNISTNHAHDFAPDYQESCLKLEGMKGAIRLTLGLILDYPKGRPDKLEYITADSGGWKELPIHGSWFPEAFIGTMGGLLRKLEDPSFHYLNDIEDAYRTMCVVEACYRSNESGETPVIFAPCASQGEKA